MECDLISKFLIVKMPIFRCSTVAARCVLYYLICIAWLFGLCGVLGLTIHLENQEETYFACYSGLKVLNSHNFLKMVAFFKCLTEFHNNNNDDVRVFGRLKKEK